MRPTATPPDFTRTLFSDPQQMIQLLSKDEVRDLIQRSNDKYLHWHDFRFRPMPKGLTPDMGWSLLKVSRIGQIRRIGLKGVDGTDFGYWLPDTIQRELHFIDQNATGQILIDEPTIGPTEGDRYVLNSLMEEAIASSILEGAATTRRKSKEMLREGRKPRNRGEQMVLNNYSTMRRIKELSDHELSVEMLCELQDSMTTGTLDDVSAGGRFRTADEEIRVVDVMDGRVLHTPPPAGELDRRVRLLCRFANETPDSSFIHPVVKAVILHFWLAYEHPFVDGNGRTARALFYWFLLKQKYWLMEFLPISRIILKAPSKYLRAFQFSESDGGDLTYFVSFNVRALRLAIEDLKLYMVRKQRELIQAKSQLRKVPGLNHRQVEILQHALNHPDSTYTIRRHMNTHGIVYQTARTDLFGLKRKGFFNKMKEGRTFIFLPSDDLSRRLKLTRH
jgi:Fic family protein